MFCVYCGIEHGESVQLSREHIVPFAMGGNDQFSIEVCAASNNLLGGSVDRPLIEFFPVSSERFHLGLRGTDGTQPTLDLGGVTWVEGQEVAIKNVIGPSGKDMRLTGRIIERIPGTHGTERWNLAGSPDAIRNALAGKIAAQDAEGKTVTNAQGVVLTLENLDQILSESMETIQNPCVLKKIDFRYLWTWRFFAKMALAVGQFKFGEGFARSHRAEQLRKTMHASTDDQAALPGGAIFPETHSLPTLLKRFANRGSHTIVISKGSPRWMYANLFGWLDAWIVLDDLNGPPNLVVGSVEVIQIDLPSRDVTTKDLSQFFLLNELSPAS